MYDAQKVTIQCNNVKNAYEQDRLLHKSRYNFTYMLIDIAKLLHTLPVPTDTKNTICKRKS